MKVRSIVTLATVALVVAGCAKATNPPGSGGDPSTSGIAHATGAGDLVIQVSNEGGFVAPSFTLTQIPQYSLYGDGSFLTPGVESEIYPGTAMPSILRQVVTEEGVQAILQAALDAGLKDGDSYTDFGSTGIADASTTVFTFAADGVTHTVKVYALGTQPGQPQGMTDAELHARKALETFMSSLVDLEKWLPAGSVGASEPYEGTGSRLFVGDYEPDPQLVEPAKAWPLDAPLAGFGTPANDMTSIRCGVVTGPDWTATLLPMVNEANELTPWTSDGTRYAISFRPLLPNETTC
jgi:hypothetical protein